MENINLYHAFMCLLGVAGIYPLYIRLKKLTNPNPLEQKIKWVLFFMMLMFLIRAPWEAFRIPHVSRVVYAVGICLMMATFLYFETLYRRHMPLWLKVLAVGSSASFLIDALFYKLTQSTVHLIAFGSYVLVLNALILFVGIRRNKQDYTRSENALIKVCLFSLPILVAFFLTDMNLLQRFFPCPKLGVLGALLFTFSTFHDQTVVSVHSSYVQRLLKAVVFSIYLTGTFMLLMPDYDLLFFVNVFVFFMIVNIFLRIHYMARDLDANDNFFSFVKNVVESNKTGLVPYLKDIRKFFDRLDIRLLTVEELKGYDLPAIGDFFEKKQTHLFTLFDLKNILSSKIPVEGVEVIEQIIDLLEKHEMSHICKISDRNDLYVVFNYHLAGQTNVIFTQTGLISEMARLIEKEESRGASGTRSNPTSRRD